MRYGGGLRLFGGKGYVAGIGSTGNGNGYVTFRGG